MTASTRLCFGVIAPVSFPSRRLSVSVRGYDPPALAKRRVWSLLTYRPAPKNHSRSRTTRPPRVPSYWLLSLLIGVGVATCVGTPPTFEYAFGDLEVHFGLVRLSRSEPLNWLPPDFVIDVTTPPVKFPNS